MRLAFHWWHRKSFILRSEFIAASVEFRKAPELVPRRQDLSIYHRGLEPHQKEYGQVSMDEGIHTKKEKTPL